MKAKVLVGLMSHALDKIAVTLGAMLLLVTVCSCASTPVTTTASTGPTTATSTVSTTTTTMATTTTITLTTTTSVTAQAVPILLPAPVDSGKNALWGFIDTNGKWVIQPQFQDAYRFFEGLATVELNGKWGYVDENGTLVVPAQFTEAYDFKDGLARVATGPLIDLSSTFNPFVTASGYGFIDKTGKIVIPATWDDAGDFSEGLAPVMQGGSVGFIDPKGHLAIPLSFEAAVSFSEGLAPAQSDGKWGYIDRSGAWVIKPQYVGAIPNAVPEYTAYLQAQSFHDGLAAVFVRTGTPENSDSRWQYIDKTGAKAFDQMFAMAGQFSEGLAPVLVGDLSEGWGFIDSSGTMVIEGPLGICRFLSLDTFLSSYAGFHEGLAMAGKDGKLGYVDKTGKFVIPPQYGAGGRFRDGFAYVWGWPSTEPDPLAPVISPTPQVGPLAIIDPAGRVIYQAPAATGSSPTGSS